MSHSYQHLSGQHKQYLCANYKIKAASLDGQVSRRHAFLRLTALYWGHSLTSRAQVPDPSMHLCIGEAQRDIAWHESGSSLNSPCDENQA